MSDTTMSKPRAGAVISTDLTVANADEVLAFYKQVIGWDSEELTMEDEQGEYADYVVKDEAGNWVGGICHKRGMNADLPPQWIVYVQVANIDESLQHCEASGGEVLKKVTAEDGSVQYALIQDPAGAVLAITK